MLKTVNRLLKLDKEAYHIPRSVQDTIPIQRIWKDGIFLVGNKYAKTYRFTDINYKVASQDDRNTMFHSYMDLLNSLDPGAMAKLTLNNRRINQKDLEESILLPLVGDDLDKYRKEYNRMLMEKATGDHGIIQEKYITISVHKRTIEEARVYFSRVGDNLIRHFSTLGARCVPLDAVEKLRILHDFYRTGEESFFHLDLSDKMKMGHDFKDYICPDSMEKHSDYLKIGEKYARVIYLKDYASFIKDEFVEELTSLNRNMMLSIDIIPVATDEAVKEVQAKMLGIETNITNWQRRQNANHNFSAIIPYDMALQREKANEFMSDLVTNNQKMFLCVLTMIHLADTKEQLDADTESLLATARERMCQMSPLKFQQLDGLNTVLPIGTRKINSMRTLITQALAVFMPFKTQEIQEEGGIYFGENAISHNMILCNMSNLLNQSMFLLGVPGSGKSFLAKLLICFLALSTDEDIIVCDPEGEYAPLIKALGGSVIRISSGSPDHINAMDMVEGYGENNPIAAKSEFLMSLIVEMDKSGVGAHQKSLIDRCTELVYREKAETGKIPTLFTLREKLVEQPEPEAQAIALSMELFTSGSHGLFAHETNVDTTNRLLVYDIHELGPQLKSPGLLTVTDAMLNRVTTNWKKGKRTHIFVDEFHVLYENEYSGHFFTSAWRQFRKRNAYPCAITQNIEYLTKGKDASTMLSNSEFIIMLNQGARDREILEQILKIPPEQMSYVTNTEAGCGLMRYGGALVPFQCKFPKDTKLYDLISTKPGEGVFSQG